MRVFMRVFMRVSMCVQPVFMPVFMRPAVSSSVQHVGLETSGMMELVCHSAVRQGCVLLAMKARTTHVACPG